VIIFLTFGAEEVTLPRDSPLFFENYAKNQPAEAQDKTAGFLPT
jgi:hypothetical protein